MRGVLVPFLESAALFRCLGGTERNSEVAERSVMCPESDVPGKYKNRADLCGFLRLIKGFEGCHHTLS